MSDSVAKVTATEPDFLRLTVGWAHDPAFDEIIESQRQIDPAKWEPLELFTNED